MVKCFVQEASITLTLNKNVPDFFKILDRSETNLREKPKYPSIYCLQDLTCIIMMMIDDPDRLKKY